MSENTVRPMEAIVDSRLPETGIGDVAIARFKANGDVDVAVILLDTFCLGVKDAFSIKSTVLDYEDRLRARVVPEAYRKDIDPACARKLIEGGIAYAQKLGFQPHPDYKKASRIVEKAPATGCATEYKYGKDGKPLYFQGPHDSDQKAERIVALLRKNCGEGNFHFIIGVRENPDFFEAGDE